MCPGRRQEKVFPGSEGGVTQMGVLKRVGEGTGDANVYVRVLGQS